MEGSRALLAVDHDGLRHVLVPLAARDEGFSDTRSRGLTVHARDLEVEEEPARAFLDVCCSERAYREAFDPVVTTLVEELGRLDSVADAVRATLARWRRFWGTVAPEGLTPDEARGLFGELWFLLVWLMPHGADSIERWTGPGGGRHDFQWPGAAVEVKTTSSTRGHIHRIHGIDQLTPPEDGTLQLFSLRLREEPSAHNTLVHLVNTISAALDSDAERLDRFEVGLTQVGYSPMHADRYEEMRYRVVDEHLYEVSGTFPRLSPASFKSGLPTGIERIEYEINLQGFDDLVVASSPAAFSPPGWGPRSSGTA